MKRDLQILGSGSYLPENEYTSEYLDNLLGLPSGTSYKTSRIKKRYWISTETATEMAVSATKEALEVAKLTIDALDLIVSACGTPIQIIPYNAVLIQEKLGLQRSGIPCFDVNSSCLSFITGLDIISHLISNGVYNRILLVSTDISSVGLNRNDLQTFANFGDGASAFIISKGDGSSSITSSHFETYSEGVHDTEVIGGGNLVHASNYVNFGEETFLFRMNGSKVFKLTLKKNKGVFRSGLSKGIKVI